MHPFKLYHREVEYYILDRSKIVINDLYKLIIFYSIRIFTLDLYFIYNPLLDYR